MVALLVGVTAMTVMIAAILPLASAETQRDKEEELIFRGLQYAEGIRNFRRKFSRYPTSLKEMNDVRPRMIRRLWKDPITNSDDWGIISGVVGAPLPGQRPGTGGPPGSPGAPLPTPTPAPTPGFGAPPSGAAPVGPVAGVYSKSKKKAFRLYQGRDVYSDWRFTEQTLTNPAGDTTAPGKPSGPGVG